MTADLTNLQIVKLLEDKAFKDWFDFSLPLSLCSDDDDTVVPRDCVRSNLCVHMASAASAISSETRGKMYVYYGPSLTGKSTAGKQLIGALRVQKGQNYPSLFVDVDRARGRRLERRVSPKTCGPPTARAFLDGKQVTPLECHHTTSYSIIDARFGVRRFKYT